MKRTAAPFYWIAIPAAILFFAFHTFPALQGFFYSLTNSRGYGTFDFVGLQNYIDLFSDPSILNSYAFTFKFAIVSTIAVNALSLLLALGLTANIRLRGFLRSVYFLPAVLAVVVVSFVANFVFSTALPAVGQATGVEALSTNILGSQSLAWIGIVLVTVWQGCAVTTVIYMSGLQTVPEELLEAATIDGANGWQRFWSITFRLIAPFVTVNVILSFKGFLMIFDQIIALTGGGPGTSTQSISFLIYRNGFTAGEFGYQSANAVIYFIVIAALSLVQLRLLRQREVSA
ncbi:sugar ABC transporter permease [Herbiconiux moechotypicola]|uniref:Sugar ABC transporter permease n=1 Tax=Herbiconiux moechotypicola TaxID=637393 RepID=A0ABN3E722_9MICO|nr:sugar ABC transporter permease [Herbiconiux moechotypicola]MCS5732003.1 sugar ABC transporter permease [Herbiconiux moechotypicola]